MKYLPLILLFSACTVGPDYQRPDADVPNTFRGGENTEKSLADLEWWKVFDDTALQELIRTALRENHDVRLAAERVLEARAQVTVTNADLYPDVDASASYDLFQNTKNGPVPIPPGVSVRQQQSTLFGSLDWEIDFWGRVRRATEAARAELLATEMVRNFVLQTLVTELALAYFELLELDAELAIARQTLVSREESRDLVALRLEHGTANQVELHQAEGLVLTTAGLIPALEQRIAQQENLIRLLMGDYPGPVARGDLPPTERREIEIPAGLPSQLLIRRPDIQVAEQNLVAANARIGEARALLYPSIRLTGSAGVSSEHLHNLFTSGSGVWALLPSVTLPIFQAGRLRANVEITESRQRQTALEYLKTLQSAFREVADSLIAHEKTREVRRNREEFVRTLSSQAELSQDRYRGGVTSYLEVLDSERDHFQGQLDLVRSIRDELFSTVFLYRALGGGWQGTDLDSSTGDPESQTAGDEPTD